MGSSICEVDLHLFCLHLFIYYMLVRGLFESFLKSLFVCRGFVSADNPRIDPEVCRILPFVCSTHGEGLGGCINISKIVQFCGIIHFKSIFLHELRRKGSIIFE